MPFPSRTKHTPIPPRAHTLPASLLALALALGIYLTKPMCDLAPRSQLRLEAVPELGYSPDGATPQGEICLRGPALFRCAGEGWA